MKKNAKQQKYISYVDLLGIGDTSEDKELYHEKLCRFRIALCESVDRYLDEPDEVFAFSDCVFASSANINRIGRYLLHLQKLLWEHNIFLKGAISYGIAECFSFSNLRLQSSDIITKREKKLKGFWFSQDYVGPALIEKGLKGVAIQIDDKVKDDVWRKENVVPTCYFSSESIKKPTVINSLRIPQDNLPTLNEVLGSYLLVSYKSRKISRYYIPLIINWINSYDYTSIIFDKEKKEYINIPLPLKQLAFNPRLASEIASLPGGEVVFYALLSKVENDCTIPAMAEKIYDYIAGHKKLREFSEYIPNEICSNTIRSKMIDVRISSLFNDSKHSVQFSGGDERSF